MKSKLIDILADNLTELTKEEIAEALEVPKKADMGDYAFPCFKLAKVLQSYGISKEKRCFLYIKGV